MIVAKQTFLFIDGDKRFKVKNEEIVADVPSWVEQTPLYKNVVRDRKIIESGKKDSEIDKALNTRTIAQETQLNEELEEVKATKKSKKKK